MIPDTQRRGGFLPTRMLYVALRHEKGEAKFTCLFFAPFHVCKQTILWSFIFSSIAGKLNLKLKVKLTKWGIDLIFYDSTIWILLTFPGHLTENLRNFFEQKNI